MLIAPYLSITTYRAYYVKVIIAVNSIRNFERLNKEFEWLNIEIRYYTAIQTLRGAIIELIDKTIFTYFSGYHWGFPDRSKASNPHPIKTSAVTWGTIVNSVARKEEKTTPLISLKIGSTTIGGLA
ncbi:MAG: hypothetical protein ACREC0_03785 [Methylocella sp.]